MTRKIFLTSLVAMSIVCPAMATETTSDFSEYMQKDTIYTGAATQTNMGVSSETAVAYAYYDSNAGYYFPANSYGTEKCPVNNYCPAQTNVLRGADNLTAVGAVACPSPYTKSDLGTAFSDRCYRDCQVGEHETSVSGREYKSGYHTCDPTCATGYHTEGLVDLFTDARVLANDKGIAAKITGDKDCNTPRLFAREGNNNTFSCSDGLEGHYGTNFTLNDLLPTSEGHQWAIDYTAGYNDSLPAIVVIGDSRCSNATDSVADNPTYVADGNTCYCKVAGIKYLRHKENSVGDELSELVGTPSRWIKYPLGQGSYCGEGCSTHCAAMMLNVDDFVVDYSSIQGFNQIVDTEVSSQKVCAISQMHVDYKCGKKDDGTTDVSSSHNAGSVYVDYGQSVTLPTSKGDCNYKGHVLVGWADGETEYELGQTMTNITQDKQLDALWAPKGVTIRFNLNGASCGTLCDANGTLKSDTYAQSAAYGVSLSTITSAMVKNTSRTGYNLDGWYLDDPNVLYYDDAGNPVTWAGNVTAYLAAPEEGDPADELVMYAKWSPATIPVEYSCDLVHGGSGSAPAGSSVTYGTSFTTATNNATTGCEKPGYTFAGWSDGTNTVAADSTYSTWGSLSNGTLKLTAVYTANKIKINWYGVDDTAGGIDGLLQTEVYYNGNITTPLAPIKLNGQTFRGWKFRKPSI